MAYNISQQCNEGLPTLIMNRKNFICQRVWWLEPKMNTRGLREAQLCGCAETGRAYLAFVLCSVVELIFNKCIRVKLWTSKHMFIPGAVVLWMETLLLCNARHYASLEGQREMKTQNMHIRLSENQSTRRMPSEKRGYSDWKTYNQ